MRWYYKIHAQSKVLQRIVPHYPRQPILKTHRKIQLKKFYITNDLSDHIHTLTEWSLINATLKGIGNHCLVYVANDENESALENSNTDNTNGKVTENQLQALADEFDSIYELMTPIFGDEYHENASSHYIAGNRKIEILVHDIASDALNGSTVGMFWSKDLQKTSSGDSLLTLYDQNFNKHIVRSNLSELLYIDSFYMDAKPMMVYSTLVHEFQHMLLFANKEHPYGLNADTWYNEMLSMLAEDLFVKHFSEKFPDYNPEIDSPWHRLPYLNYGYITGPTTWLNSNYFLDDFYGADILISYANAYGFGAWLARNYGGLEFIKTVARNNLVDEGSIAQAAGKDMKSLLFEYALTFTNQNDPLSMKKEVSNANTPLYAIDLWTYNNGPVSWNNWPTDFYGKYCPYSF